jgi:hypothetical protein
LVRPLSVRGAPIETSAWKPWQDAPEFNIGALLGDVGLWIAVVLLAAGGTQWWRSNRRALWKPQISDLMLLIAVAGSFFAWIANERLAYLNESAALADQRQRHGTEMAYKSASIPGFVPAMIRDSYHRAFDRVTFFSSKGDSDLARRFARLATLQEVAPGPTFRSDLQQLPQLEALSLHSARLPFFDVTRQATILRGLPPMPNLRVVDLYATDATVADMAWLAKCPRLEMIDLAETEVGDRGLLALRELPRLKWLSISGHNVTDRGCQTVAEFPALEELRIASRNIHDEGVRELARLTNLRVLNVSAAASENAFAELRQALPKCQITTRAY